LFILGTSFSGCDVEEQVSEFLRNRSSLLQFNSNVQIDYIIVSQTSNKNLFSSSVSVNLKHERQIYERAGVNFNSILQAFLYESVLQSFSVKGNQQKAPVKTLVKLTTCVNFTNFYNNLFCTKVI